MQGGHGNLWSCDVLGLGAVAVDDLLYVDAYPPPDAKTPVRARDRQGGGLTGTALVTAARLGARAAYAGVLGDDDLSAFALHRFMEEGVDVTFTARRPGATTIHSTIIVDRSRGTRNIFYEAEGFIGAATDWPDPAVIGRARVLFVDSVGLEGMIRAARIAREGKVPVVADLEREGHPRLPELVELADHLVVPVEFACSYSGQSDPAQAARVLHTSRRSAVVVTCGADGAWFIGEDDPDPRHQPAFPVTVADTTGCGDVFHGAYAAMLARGLGLAARVRVAAAAAALKAARPGGQAGIPGWDAVRELAGIASGEVVT